MADDITWVRGHTDTLKPFGFTLGTARGMRALQELHDYAIASYVAHGESENIARDYVESTYIKPSKAGKSYFINEEKLGALRNWVERDDQWISHNNYPRLKEVGISFNSDKVAYQLQSFHDHLVQEYSDSLGSELAQLYVEHNIVRESKARKGGDVWQIQRSHAPQMLHFMEHEGKPIDWVNHTNHARLKQLGCQFGDEKAAEGMEALYNMAINRKMYRKSGGTLDHAKAQAAVEKEFISPVQSGDRTIWRMNADKTQHLADWYERDQNWVSCNNRSLLKHEGVTASSATVSKAMQHIYDAQIKRAESNYGPELAADFVENFIVRENRTPQNNLVWQMQRSHMDLLQKEIEHPTWIDSHSLEQMRGVGIVTNAKRTDALLKSYYEGLITRVMDLHPDMELSQAKDYIHKDMLKPSETGHGSPSWKIHRSYTNTLLASVPELSDMRRGGDWLSAASPLLARKAQEQGLDIPHSPTTTAKAMATLHERSCNAIGKPQTEAKVVRLGFGNGGREVWQLRATETNIQALYDVRQELFPGRGKGRADT